MRTNCKKTIAALLAVILLIGVCSAPLSALAAFSDTVEAFTYDGVEIPAYDGDYYECIHENEPRFTEDELNQEIYESYGALDSLGRVTVCSANIDRTLMPAKGEECGNISSVHPTGWVQHYYDFVNNHYLYNRCHLIGWQLTAESANERNLMTGTRSFNYFGMLPFENEVASYLKADTENNVLYRVTPVFQGNNLLASGVIMEAESVDDGGAAVSFCVFVYNTEPGVTIDYATGANMQIGTTQDISSAYLWLSTLYPTYTGKALRPLEYVKLGNTVLTAGRDYTVSYTNNVSVGTATVTVKGIGMYSGTATKLFTIKKPTPKKPKVVKATGKKKAFYVKWNAVSNVSGYQVQYATNKKFKSARTVTVNSKSAKSKTVKKLKAKKTYYIRVRAYKTVNKKKFCSAWSSYKKIKTK